MSRPVNANVSVRYQAGCNSGKQFTVRYTNQTTVTPGSFLQAGDSGSLMVTNDANHQPVGLLYAGSSSVAIANPIQDVVRAFEPACGGPGSFTFVGTTCSAPTALAGSFTTTSGPAPARVDVATQVKGRHVGALMSHSAVLGVGVGAADDDPSEAVLVLYVEQGRPHPPLPEALDGVRVKLVYTDRIVAMVGGPCRE